MWVVIFETGRVLAFVKFEAGRAINDGAIHPELLIPNVGLEPTPPCGDRILSPARLPYSWYWKHVAAMLKVFGFTPVTMLACPSDIVVALG